jgi:hypothetical protein
LYSWPHNRGRHHCYRIFNSSSSTQSTMHSSYGDDQEIQVVKQLDRLLVAIVVSWTLMDVTFPALHSLWVAIKTFIVFKVSKNVGGTSFNIGHVVIVSERIVFRSTFIATSVLVAYLTPFNLAWLILIAGQVKVMSVWTSHNIAFISFVHMSTQLGTYSTRSVIIKKIVVMAWEYWQSIINVLI